MIGIIFARESNRYDKTVYSLKSQVDACQERAKADGAPVEERHVFREQFSGRDLHKMPKLAAMRKFLAETPGPKVIYCYSQDRLVRGEDSFDIFYLLVEFRRLDAELRLILNPIQPRDIASQIFALVKGHEASTEIDKILDRTMRGKLQRIKEGKIPGFGRNKYGYTKDQETGKAAINEAEAAVLRRICKALLGGVSLNAMTRALNAEGVPSPFGSKGETVSKRVKFAKWWPSALGKILRDSAYKGCGAALRGQRRNGSNAARPRQDWIELPGDCYPPILDPADWDRLQEVLMQNRGDATRNVKNPALLRGLIFCAVCGRRYYPTNKPHGDKKYIYYRCASLTERLNDSNIRMCEGRPIAAGWIEDAAWRRIVEEISDPAKLRAALARGIDAVRGCEAQDELESMRGELAKRDAQERNLARELRDATPAVARTIKDELERIESERGALLAREGEISRRQAASEHRRLKIEETEQLVIRMVKMKKLDILDFERKRIILEELEVKVMVNGREFKVWPFDE